MQRSKTDFWVGLFVLIGAAALIFLALQAANLLQLNWRTQNYTVSAHFDNIGGLKPRAAVRSSGVVVGRVATITYDDALYRAKVVLELDKQYRFSRDSALKILTSGLLGDQYIGLEPGYEDENLQDGDTITATQSAIVLENLISAFMFNKAAEPATPAPSSAAQPPAPAPAAPSPSPVAPQADTTKPAALLKPQKQNQVAAIINAGITYPAESLRQREEGTVRVRALIGINGRAKEAAIVQSSGFSRLDNAAIEGILHNGRFTPSRRNGLLVDDWYIFPINFKLPR